MTKVFCEIVLLGTDGKKRTYKCAGITKEDAEKKLLKSFPDDKVISNTFLHEYDEADYGWC
ncbi:MAG: hypothetical protein J6O99_07035 [Methanobrevibacter sp.]|nr:hypothetical protein [Methanobrevibacter sp.]